MWQMIKRRILAGLIALMPIMATYWIVRILFDFLDNLADPILKLLGIQIPGLGNYSNLFIHFYHRIIGY